MNDPPSTWQRYFRFWGQRVEREVDLELRFHFDMRVQELVERGMSESDARHAVLRRLGDIDQSREQCITVDRRQQRQEARVEQLDTLKQDLKLVVRTLAREKLWTSVVVATLALGIGANSALFTIINAVLIRPLPYPRANEIVAISESDKGVDRSVVADATFDAWARDSRAFTALSVVSSTSAILNLGNDPQSVTGGLATANYFAVMRTQPERGRTFTEDEDRLGGPAVVVLSDQLWRTTFGADSAILGKSIALDGNPTTVIGVMPPSFTSEKRAQYWVPYRRRPVAPDRTFFYSVIGRLRPGVTTEAARAELAAISKRVDSQRGATARHYEPVVKTLHDARHGDSRRALLILLGAVGVLLLIACANVANLLLARAARRRKEFAVRIALGATRWRLVRYLLGESLVLSLTGGALGLLIPFAAVGYFVKMSPTSVASAENIGVDGGVLFFTFAVAVITGIIFGLVPAFDAARNDVGPVMSTGSSRTTHTRGQNTLRRGLVVTQLATALVLVTGAALLTRSFARVMSIDLGFSTDRVLTADFRLPRNRYPETAIRPFFDQIMARVRSLPGVQVAALGEVPPLGGARMSMSTKDKDGNDMPAFDVTGVGPGYFDVIGTAIISGRSITEADREDSPHIAVMNHSLARLMFKDREPVGATFKIGSSEVTVVGVVKDVIQRQVEGAPTPIVYVPIDQNGGPSSRMIVLVRTLGDPLALTQPMRDVAHAVDPTLPPPRLRAMTDVLAEAVAPRRFSFALLATLASLALVLAIVGLYGVMSYLVADRTREIGIRVALGADRGRVVGLVVGQGMTLTLIGVVLGLVASVAAVRLLRSMLYQVSIYDPIAFTGGAALLAVAAFAACYVPARRATRVDPVVALRGD